MVPPRSSRLVPTDVVRIGLTRPGSAAEITQLTHVNDDVLGRVKCTAVTMAME